MKRATSRAVRLNINVWCWKCSLRHMSYTPDSDIEITSNRAIMKGWHINKYGGIDELKFSRIMKRPLITRSNEFLIHVHSAGVNALDVAMIGGYGHKRYSTSKDEDEFPIIMGREFCGEIVQKGINTTKELSIGDQVWGLVPFPYQGSHADYVVVPEGYVAPKPPNLTTEEAGSLLFSGATAWSGLFMAGSIRGGPLMNTVNSPKVLVLGASGSIGASVIQILKAENARVIAACKPSRVPLVQSLEPEQIIDYTKDNDFIEQKATGPYDLIVDCTGRGPHYAKTFGLTFDQYVNFSSPLSRPPDKPQPNKKSIKISDLLDKNSVDLATKQGRVKNAHFTPSIPAIKYLTKLVESNKYYPYVDTVYGYRKTPNAYKKVKDGYQHGRVVINFNSGD